MFQSEHPADHVDSSQVGPGTAEEAEPPGGVNYGVAGPPSSQLAQLPGSSGLVESGGEGEPRVAVNSHGRAPGHLPALTVQDVRLGPCNTHQSSNTQVLRCHGILMLRCHHGVMS